ncbi:MAG: methyltransferase domain-containing protein [Fibrobacterales bacterium]
MLEWIYQKAKSLKGDTEHLTYGRPIIQKWIKDYAAHSHLPLSILDIGCGQGDDLIGISKILNEHCTLAAIEAYEPYREILLKKGIEAHGCNIERDTLPWPTETFDVVVINQVLEHTKDIFWVCGEISRVLKPGGRLIIGVPNLAAWHDRAMLLLGMEPTSNHMLGPHPRGITRQGMERFIQTDGYFTISNFAGSGFYPFPTKTAQRLSSLLPNLSTSIFFSITRSAKDGSFVSILDNHFFETNYYRGPTHES